jgi:hypothetical protein
MPGWRGENYAFDEICMASQLLGSTSVIQVRIHWPFRILAILWSFTKTRIARALFRDDLHRIQSLLKLFEGLDTDQAEIIATWMRGNGIVPKRSWRAHEHSAG